MHEMDSKAGNKLNPVVHKMIGDVKVKLLMKKEELVTVESQLQTTKFYI